MEMEVNPNQVEYFEKMDDEIKSEEEITDLELDVKIENLEKGNIKTEFFEEKQYYESFQIIGEKRKNQEISNLENKKIKEELIVFEELDDQIKFEELEEIDLDSLNNEVLLINVIPGAKTIF